MKTFADFIDQLERHGNKRALVDANTAKSLSYTQLVSQTRMVAASLQERGLKPGERIVLYDVPGIAWVPIFLAAQLAHIIVVPVDTRASMDLVRSMIKKTKPRLIVSQHRLALDTPIATPHQLLRKTERSFIQPRSKKPPIAEILLTSGTWSEPKGVTLSQQNILANLAAAEKIYSVDSSEVFLSVLPLAHAYEQMCGLFMPLHAGASIVYLPEITAAKLTDTMKQYSVTMLVAVPRLLHMLRSGILRKVSPSRRSIFTLMVLRARNLPIRTRRLLFKKVHAGIGPYLHTIVIGGAPLEQPIDHFFQGLGYNTLIGYGLSETSPILSISTDPKRPAGSVGKPLHNVRLKLNAHNEVLVSGPSIFVGYWPKSRTETWFNTEDQAVVNADGHIVLTGRTKNMIIFPNGDKLFLEDIENITDSHPGVEESVAVTEGDDLHLLIRAKNSADIENVRRYVLSKLPSSVRIRAVHNIHPASLQRTHTLKLNRKKIADEYRSRLNGEQ